MCSHKNVHDACMEQCSHKNVHVACMEQYTYLQVKCACVKLAPCGPSYIDVLCFLARVLMPPHEKMPRQKGPTKGPNKPPADTAPCGVEYAQTMGKQFKCRLCSRTLKHHCLHCIMQSDATQSPRAMFWLSAFTAYDEGSD